MTEHAASRAWFRTADIIPDHAWRVGAVGGLLMLAVALFNPGFLSDPDTYWHLAAGDWILNHRLIPHADPFSFTRAGAPWHVDEWLSEVIMALAYRAGGWSGVVTLFGLSLGAAALLLTGRLRGSLSDFSLMLTLTLALGCMGPNLLARPHVLVLPIIIAWTAALLKARDDRRAPAVWMAGLMLAWANMHGSFVLGFVLLGAFALEALGDAPAGQRWHVARAWGVFAAIALVAAAITPQGPMGLIYPFQLMNVTSTAFIIEWRPIDFSKPGTFELALAVTLFVGLSRGVKVQQTRLLLLIIMLHMALQHARYVTVLAPVAAMVLAAPFAAVLSQSRPELKPARAPAWLIFGTLVLALILGRFAVPLTRVDGIATPRTALDHVPATLRNQPVLNGYDFGGYLIFRGVRPFIDGRADPYGDAFFHRYAQIASGDPAILDQALRGYNITWTILPPGLPATALMDARPGWRRLYADKFAVIHERIS